MKGKCEVCTNVESKYKCPSCLILYCSLGCYKQHKEAKCEAKPEDETKNDSNFKVEKIFDDDMEEGELSNSPDITNDIDEDDWVPQEKLELLGHSEEVKTQLKNKHLQKLLMDVDSSPNPGEELDKAMQIPIFTEFVDVCMKVIEGDSAK